MKLRILDRGKEKEIEVKFWSFLKCTVLVQLTMAGIIYGAMFIIFLFMAFAGILK